MKGGVNVKTVLTFGLILAAILALATLAPLAAAEPRKEIKVIWMKLVDQHNRPLANERVRIVVWNESDPNRAIYKGGYPIAYFDGETDKEGKVELKLTGIAPIYMDSSKFYNVTIAIFKYGKWLLLNQSARNVPFAAINQTYFNRTVIATNWWTFNFTARDYRHNQPLYSVSPLYGPENASFIIYVGGVKAMEIWADENGLPDKLFNISDTEVTFRVPREGWFLIAGKKNVTFVKELYLNLRKGKDVVVPVLVGKDQATVGRDAQGPFYNFTDLIGQRLYGEIEDFAHLTGVKIANITNYGYTYTLLLDAIYDLCGQDLTLGDPTYWAIAIQAEIDKDLVILSSGIPAARSTFYIPDVSLVYNKPVTIIITYYNVPVLSVSLNLTKVEYDYQDASFTFFSITYGTTTVEGTATFVDPDTIEIVAPVTVIPVRIQVFDKQAYPQPLKEARVLIEAAVVDPIYTATGADGYVYMPPFRITGIADIGLPGGETGWGVVKESVYSDVIGPYGYLPVPFEYNKSEDLEFVYRVRVWWRMPGGVTWVEVTDPENSTIRLNPKRYIKQIAAEEECLTLSFKVYVNVFEVKALLLDLCGRPISPTAFPGATVAVFLNDVLIGATSPGPDGTITLKFLPGGDLKLRLLWKSVLMRANVTPPGTPEPVIKVDRNIAFKVPKLMFPIGDVALQLTMWDVNYALKDLNVTLVYLKDGKEAYRESWARTNCTGMVVFSKVPLLPLEPARYEIRVLAYTWETNYTRTYITSTDIDDNLLVLNTTLAWDTLAPDGSPRCENKFVLPTWIYSFKVLAVDHAGAVLKHFKTSIGDYPVTVILVDQAYEERASCCPELCPEIPVAYPLVDFRIMNATTAKNPEAVFTYYSQQFFEQDPDGAKIGIKPHLFVAGAKYRFLVFHGGVLVFNYTITLPRPDETVTVIFNETDKKVKVVKGIALDQYSWAPHIVHPIMVFKGAPSHAAGGSRAQAELHLVTWVQTLTVETKTNAGKLPVPFLNLTLFRNDVLNWTIIKRLTYEELIDPDAWAGLWTGYAWSAVGDDKGVIRIQVPIWMPHWKGESWLAEKNIKFGAEITKVFVLAGAKWNSPGIPDTPPSKALVWQNATEDWFSQGIFGYVVNWNHTAKVWGLDATAAEAFFPEWTKAGLTFRGNNTKVFGDFWNMTYWSGASKTVRTVAMDGACVRVSIPPPCPGAELIPYPGAYVEIAAKGKTIASGVADEEGMVKFAPPAAYIYKYVLEYTLRTKQSFDEFLGPYKLTEAAANICPEWLEQDVTFTEDHNEFAECVEFAWSAIYVYVEDWGGKPLTNMMVAAYSQYPEVSGGITTFAFSKPFAGAAIARLLVRPDRAYRLVVFWRDSYLLSAAKVIPSYISIYDSIADEIQPRLYSADADMFVPFYAVVTGGSVKTFVYIGMVQLLTKEGKALSPDALAKITVTITWPDGVVTQVKPGSDGVAPIILNKATVKKWPVDASAAYNPESAHPQSPPGEYKVLVEWAGVGKIAEKTLRITRAKLDTPEIKEPVYLDVTDIEISLITPFGTPMADAEVEAALVKSKLPPRKLIANAQGKIIVPEVPQNETIELKVLSWNGMPINFVKTIPDIKYGIPITPVKVENIGKLVITVVGARGQGLEGAKVTISGGITLVGTTDAAGKFAVELPAGPYTVTAEKGGRTMSESVTVPGGEPKEVTIKIDVFMTLAGWEMSFSEFVGLLLLIALLAIVLFIIAHEYAVWRRRRLARAIVPAKPEGA